MRLRPVSLDGKGGIPQWLLVLALALLTGACGNGLPAAPGAPSWSHVASEQIDEAKEYGVPVAFENDMGMRFVLIPSGTFRMGSPESEKGRKDDEALHQVVLTTPYYVQTREVTNAQGASGNRCAISRPDWGQIRSRRLRESAGVA